MKYSYIVILIYLLLSYSYCSNTNITNVYYPKHHNLIKHNSLYLLQSHRILQEYPSDFILSFAVIPSENNILRCKVCIGFPEKCGMFKLSTTSSLTWTFSSPNNSLYNPTLSSKSKNLRTSIQHFSKPTHQIELDLYEDTFSIDSYSFGLFTFGIIPSTSQVYSTLYDGAIGLGYSYSKSPPSLLEHISTKNIIDYNVFYIHFYSNDKASLKIGNFPYDSYYMDHFMMKTCNVFKYKENSSINVNDNWECLLNGIYYRSFGKVYFHKVNERVVFDASLNCILVSEEFFDVFVKEYFGNFITTNQCVVERSADMGKSVQCKEEANYKLLPKIKFMIGKWSVSFGYEDIMRKTEFNTMECLIKKDNEVNKFVFGFPLFYKFIVIFDKMSSRIGLIRNERNKK